MRTSFRRQKASSRRLPDLIRVLAGDPFRHVLLCALVVGSATGCTQRERDERPNIILILTDDHRSDALGVASDLPLRTPALDRLAAEGIRFTSAFVTTSLCSPSRASFFTGCYAHTHGVLGNEVREPDTSLPLFPELLQAAGYETAFIGKWHMLKRATPRRGFDHWVSFTGQGEYTRNTLNIDGEWVQSNGYITDELTQYARRFIARDRNQPFLLVLSHKAAHSPFEPAPRHEDRYADIPFGTLNDPRDDLASKPQWGGRSLREQEINDIRDYHRCLLAVDESVDQIMTELRQGELLDRTAIIYTSDNGYLHGEHGGLWDKRVAYDPSIHIPLLMRVPSMAKPGSRIDELVLNIDLAPTVLEIAGVSVPETMQGSSWLPLTRGEPGRNAFLYEYFREVGPVPTIMAIRTREWKYVSYPQDPDLPAELYNLKDDPLELENRIDDEGYANTLASLRQQLSELQYETGLIRSDGPR